VTKRDIIARIAKAFDTYVASAPGASADLVPDTLKAGKLYEAHVLAAVARELVIKEGFELRLVQGSKLVLKASPGPINAAYPHIQAYRNGQHVADLWTDVEFTTLSFRRSGLSFPQAGHYHELDIAMVDAGATGRPTPAQVWLAVECKNTPFEKALLRQILGVRRELSLLQASRDSRFQRWPASQVPADPPSCLVVYSTSSAVTSYAAPGSCFGIEFVYEPLTP
jgi:hypothetical protein